MRTEASTRGSACPLSGSLAEQIASQRAVIARFELALWENGFNESLLPSYQSAWRRLEALIAAQGNDTRHHFVIVIPVADNPQQLRTCLDSLLELCRTFGYGGMHDETYQKVSVLIADDTCDPGLIAANQAIAREFDQSGIATTYFGLADQITLMASLPANVPLTRITGDTSREAFSHKGQAVMRNIAYLKLAQRHATEAHVLFYTVDADQTFKVNIPKPDGSRNVCAVNFLAQLDAIFSATDALVLTGKVVGDPPVSPAVMAANFLEDVIGFVREMTTSDPHQTYRQQISGTQGSGESAYHDMADLFGFSQVAGAYRYRCALPGSPGNAACFDDFSKRLERFFHGEHPTRITWYDHSDALASVQPARTVYTGNYIFRPEALEWFIPFAPLRLRMSGPSLGRMLRSALGHRFVSANLPMLHTRTMDATGQSEFRPGVVTAQETVELCDEFERQFYGDVMLFTIERLAGMDFPQQEIDQDVVVQTLDAVHS